MARVIGLPRIQARLRNVSDGWRRVCAEAGRAAMEPVLADARDNPPFTPRTGRTQSSLTIGRFGTRNTIQTAVYTDVSWATVLEYRGVSNPRGPNETNWLGPALWRNRQAVADRNALAVEAGIHRLAGGGR